jgi:hypothetical protein
VAVLREHELDGSAGPRLRRVDDLPILHRLGRLGRNADRERAPGTIAPQR